MRQVSMRRLRSRRSVVVFVILLILFVFNSGVLAPTIEPTPLPAEQTDVLSEQSSRVLASEALETLAIKGRAAKTGYSRGQFGDGWATIGKCDIRNIMLARGMVEVVYGSDNCTVLRGTLIDPYTGKTIQFTRGGSTSADVQIDHVVALSDAWQKGAQELSSERRMQFANDPLNLLAVDGPANQQKGDGDAATWLPPNRSFRCQYVARQIAVKSAYSLWVTEAEYSAMKRILNGCGEQVLPVVL